jgi:general secretion pathway protein N
MSGAWSLGRLVILAALLLAAAGLGEVVAIEVARNDAADVDRPTTPSAAPALGTMPAAQAGFALPPLRSLGEVTARPLFSPSRRPPPPQASQDALRRSASLVLEGVILSPRERIALISHGLPAVVTRVPEGGQIEGWSLAEIYADRIVLQQGATREEIKLVDKTTKPRAAVPPKP